MALETCWFKSYYIYVVTKQTIMITINNTVPSDLTIKTQLNDLINGYWRENICFKPIMSLCLLIIKLFYDYHCDFVEQVIGYQSLEFWSLIRLIQHNGVKPIESNVKFKSDLLINTIYQYEFRVKLNNNRLLIGLVNDYYNEFFVSNWWGSSDYGLCLDINSGFFVTYSRLFRPISDHEYIDWNKLNGIINKKKKLSIKIRINRINETVRYFINEKDMGIAFHLQSTCIYRIGITLTAKNQYVQLLNCKQLHVDDSILDAHDESVLTIPHPDLRLELQHSLR